MNEYIPRFLLLAHAAATLFMMGLIWFVQIVHYPLFDATGSAEFSAYERRHTALTSWVVGPPMLVEAVTTLLLFWFRPTDVPIWQLWTGLVFLGVLWLSTLLVQVPCHEILSQGFESLAHRRLVYTNWVRTAAWSLRGGLVLWMTWNLMK